MAALEIFEATEANLVKLERLWAELEALVLDGIGFGSSSEHEDRGRSFARLLTALPKIDGWRPTTAPMDVDDIAQNRFDALELGMHEAAASVERELALPGRELREYRFRLAGAKLR